MSIRVFPVMFRDRGGSQRCSGRGEAEGGGWERQTFELSDGDAFIFSELGGGEGGQGWKGPAGVRGVGERRWVGDGAGRTSMNESPSVFFSTLMDPDPVSSFLAFYSR